MNIKAVLKEETVVFSANQIANKKEKKESGGNKYSSLSKT